MSACSPLTYSGVSGAAWTELKALVLKQYGITIGADSGAQLSQEFTIEWAYDSKAETLRLQCIDSPFFITCNEINSTIDEMVKGCLGGING